MNRGVARSHPATRSPTWRRMLGTLLVASLFGPAASAQTLGEVVLVSAIMSQLHPVTTLPSGSLRAEGAGATALAARLPDASAWTDWEVYTATGLVMALEGALVHNVETELMVAGLWRVSRDETLQGGERHVRYVFEGDAGRMLLHVIRSDDALIWLLARGR